jgi:hypothetical protein
MNAKKSLPGMSALMEVNTSPIPASDSIRINAGETARGRQMAFGFVDTKLLFASGQNTPWRLRYKLTGRTIWNAAGVSSRHL